MHYGMSVELGRLQEKVPLKVAKELAKGLIARLWVGPSIDPIAFDSIR
jgi:hypothetical protein